MTAKVMHCVARGWGSRYRVSYDDSNVVCKKETCLTQFKRDAVSLGATKKSAFEIKLSVILLAGRQYLFVQEKGR